VKQSQSQSKGKSKSKKQKAKGKWQKCGRHRAHFTGGDTFAFCLLPFAF
jgi:hypothetical protein